MYVRPESEYLQNSRKYVCHHPIGCVFSAKRRAGAPCFFFIRKEVQFFGYALTNPRALRPRASVFVGGLSWGTLEHSPFELFAR